MNGRPWPAAGLPAGPPLALSPEGRVLEEQCTGDTTCRVLGVPLGVLSHRSLEGPVGLHVESLSAMIRSLAEHPGDLRQVTAARYAVTYAHRCESPVVIPRIARAIGAKHGYEWHWDEWGRRLHETHKRTVRMDRALLLDMEVPCRICAPCRKARAHHWRLRTIVETGLAKRTWFSTFTLDSDQQWHNTLRACQLARRANLDLDALDCDQQFGYRVRALGPELTAFFKRVRKNSSAPIRFVWVAEMHLGGGVAHGLPHIHALIHEKSDVDVVRKRILHDAWKLGYSAHKLVQPDETLKRINYLCKYLFKQTKCPIRASNRYGNLPSFTYVKERGPAPITKCGGTTTNDEGTAQRIGGGAPEKNESDLGCPTVSFEELMRQF